MSFLAQKKIDIEVIVTDRHIQINKWIRENLPDIKHYFDVWHGAKGMYMHVNNCSFWFENFENMTTRLKWLSEPYINIGWNKMVLELILYNASVNEKEKIPITEWDRPSIYYLFVFELCIDNLYSMYSFKV